MNTKKLLESKVIQTQEDKQREIKRIKKELEEKERIEKRINDLEEEARNKERIYKEKYQNAELRR